MDDDGCVTAILKVAIWIVLGCVGVVLSPIILVILLINFILKGGQE